MADVKSENYSVDSAIDKIDKETPKPKTRKVFVSDLNVTVNVPETWDGSKIRYETEKALQNGDDSKFIGGVKVNPLDTVQTVNKLLEEKRYKEIGEETNPLLTFGKSAYNTVADLTAGSIIKGEGVVEDITSGVVGYAKDDELSPEARKRFQEERELEAWKTRRKRAKQSDVFMADINPNESKVAQNLGNVTASMSTLLAGMGKNALKKMIKSSSKKEMAKSVLPMTALFGYSSGIDMYNEVRENGGSIVEASLKGSTAGVAETALETWGLSSIFTALKAKRLGRYAVSAITEGGTEALQSGKDIIVAGKRDKREADEKFNDVVDSAIWGSIGGVLGLGLAKVATREQRAKVANAAVNAGYDLNTAKRIADSVVLDDKTTSEQILDIINTEEENKTDLSEKELQALKRTYDLAQDLSSNLSEEDTKSNEVFYNTLNDKLVKAGINEEEADVQSRYWTRTVKTDYEQAKENGYKGTLADFQKEYLDVNVQLKEKYEEGKPEKLFSSAGVNSKTAPLADLERAKEMSVNNVDEKEIYAKTGWYLGDEGEWKYEISDADMEVNPNLEEIMYHEDLTLGDVINHDLLFEAYPYLKDVSVDFGVVKGGEAEVIGSKIRIDDDFVGNDKKIKSILAHEIQHLIQEREGFAVGGNPNIFAENQMEQYNALSGEVEARNTSNRMELGDLGRRMISPNETRDVPKSDSIVLRERDLRKAETGKLFSRKYPENYDYVYAKDFNDDDTSKLKEKLKKDVSDEVVKRIISTFGKSGQGRGYSSSGESVNASIARSDGLATAGEISKLLKDEYGYKIPAKDIKHIISPVEKHHTGTSFRETDFYDIEDLTKNDIENYFEQIKWEKDQKNKFDKKVKELGLDKMSNEELVSRYDELYPSYYKSSWEVEKKHFGEKEARHRFYSFIIQAEQGKLFSRSSSENKKLDDINNNNTLLSKGDEVYGVYDPSERLIELFENARPDTLTHELSHHFFQNHFRMAEKYGLTEQDKKTLNWLGKQTKHNITKFDDMTSQDWENLTESFIRYLNTGLSPNLYTTSLFTKAKKWVIDVFNDNRDYASPEVVEFFDNLVSKENVVPNMDKIMENKNEFKKVLQSALKGEEVNFKNLSIVEVNELKRAINARVRRKAKTLAQELKEDGFTVDTVNGELKGKNGVIEDRALALLLSEKGVLVSNIETETYEQLDKLSDELKEIISNSEYLYSAKEQEVAQEREISLMNQAHAEEIVNDILKDNKLGLKDIRDLDNLLSKIVSKEDNVDIVKINRSSVKYLESKVKELDKNYKNTIKQLKLNNALAKETQYQLQSRMKDFIKGLPLDGNHKLSLIGNIQRVKDEGSFEKVLTDVTKRAKDYAVQEMKELNRKNIDETIKSTKPKSIRKQRYTYKDNKFFQEAREINSMNSKQAEKALEQANLDIAEKMENNEKISEYDRLKNMLLTYKTLGSKTSLELLQDLSQSLEALKIQAIMDKFDMDALKGEVRAKDKEELLTAIKTLDKSNIVARGLARINTLYSTMNEYFGKDLADKWNLEVKFEEVNIFMNKYLSQSMKKGMDIYHVDGNNKTVREGNFIKIIQERSKKEYSLTDNDKAKDKLSIMDIMDIHIGMKDPNTRANYYASYEKFDDTMPKEKPLLRQALEHMSSEEIAKHMLTNNIGNMLEHLTDEDMKFADYLQEQVADMWEIENKTFVKLYGIDLPHTPYYFPRTSKTTLDYDVAANLKVRGQTPNMYKERAKTVIPAPKNVWVKYQEYVGSVAYMDKVALKYRDLRALLSNSEVSSEIRDKYSDQAYTSMMANIEDLSVKGALQTYNEVGGFLQKVLNNIVSAQISVNAPMASKQIISFVNYAVNMPTKDFARNVIEGLKNWKQAQAIVDEYVGDFLETRFRQGSQSEALGRVISEANSIINSKYELGKEAYIFKKATTFFLRYADILAIRLGGYAKLKYMIDKGMSKEKIREDFIRETLRNQSAGNPATIAKFQRDKGLRIATAFKNVPAQYTRLIFDTITQHQRGEISDDRFYKNMANYIFIQPSMYIWFGYLISSYLYDDDDKDWYDGMLSEIVTSPIAGIPFISDITKFETNQLEARLFDKKPDPWNPISVFGIDYLNKLVWKTVKKDKNAWDFAEILAGAVDVFTGAGLSTVVRNVNKITD